MNAHVFGSDSDAAPEAGQGVSAPDSGREIAPVQERYLVPVASQYGDSNHEQAEPSSFDVLRYWGLVLKYRWVFLTGLIAAICIGYGTTMLATRMYRATATIEIDQEAPKVIELGEHQQIGESIRADQFYDTQFGLLKSRSLAERVVADLDLANQPNLMGGTKASPWTRLRHVFFANGQAPAKASFSARTNAAIDMVAGGLSVQPVPQSALVHLSFEGPNPEAASTIVNAVSTAFIKSNLEHRYDATAYARNFLQDQLAQIKLKLEQAERGLVAYDQKKHTVHLDGNQPLAAADLIAVNTELAKVRAERIQNEQLWQQAKSTVGMGLPEILNDKTIQSLRTTRADLESQYQDKLGMFKPDFPDMKRLKAQINQVEHEIRVAIDVIKDSIKARYEASLQQEQLLEQQLRKNTDTVLNIQSQDIEYTILQRDVGTERILYNALMQRYKDVGVAGGVGTNNISVVDPARVPGAPFSPSLKKNLGISLALGLAASALVAYILELLDDTFKTPEQVEELLGVPTLGLTPIVAAPLTVQDAWDDPHSAFSEAFRSVRTALQFSTDTGVPKSLLITSSRQSEGKSTAALALARNFAQLGLKVLLVDADLRNPSLHRALGYENTRGLSNYLAGSDLGANTLQKTSTAGLTFLASGPLPPNPAELLASPNLPSFLGLAHQTFDLIILDGPPVMGLADALLLGSVVAGTLMIVAACDTRRAVAKGSLKRLHFARARVIGALLSKFDAKKVGFAYGYGYGYGGTDYYGYGVDTLKLADTSSE